jgi:hypothetical protein
VGWLVPGYNGGCSISGYNVFLNEIEVVSFDSANVFGHIIDMSSGVIGQIYKVKVRATNYAGSV